MDAESNISQPRFQAIKIETCYTKRELNDYKSSFNFKTNADEKDSRNLQTK